MKKDTLSFQEANLDYNFPVLDRDSVSSVAIDKSFSDAPFIQAVVLHQICKVVWFKVSNLN